MSPDEPVIEVRRAGPLSGSVVVPGAKNSVLKLMAASLLGEGDFVISNVPRIIDVGIMADLLEGVGLSMDLSEMGVVRVTNDGNLDPVAPPAQARRIRASVNLLGPLLARLGTVSLAMPGGDDFGTRPIDLHINALEQMGAVFDYHDGILTATADRLNGAEITFVYPSVGATENVMTAAVLADGVTTIHNAAREPEIVDLCEFLVAMGAKIDGVGTPTLTITGVGRDELYGCEHRTVPDRIQAATYVAACAVSGGEILIDDARADHMQTVLSRFRMMGVKIEGTERGLSVVAPERLTSVDVATLPYPGVATDYKPLIMTVLAVADGSAVVTENLYPGRFRYVDELQKMGADILVDGHHALVRGVERLRGTDVESHDIRAGAAMVVAGLAADGMTTIHGVHHIDRGYDDLVGRLQSVGADIVRR